MLSHPLDVVDEPTTARILDELKRRGELTIDAAEEGGARITFACPHCGAPGAGALVEKASRWKCQACPAGGSAASLAVTVGVDEWQITETLRRREVDQIASTLLEARIDPDLVLRLAEAFDAAHGAFLTCDEIRALVTRAAERELGRRGSRRRAA